MVNEVKKPYKEDKNEIKPNTTVPISKCNRQILQSMDNKYMKGRNLGQVQHNESILVNFCVFLYN